MTVIKNILVASILSASLFTTAQAAEQTVKPLQGISFHAGSKHAVAYFLPEGRTCKLVVTAADDAHFAPTRREAAIAPGTSTKYVLADSKALEFTCQAGAHAMAVKSLATVAAN